ncbi:MAG: anhydro-N-acetylmuramic acid kinase [Legionella sp.]
MSLLIGLMSGTSMDGIDAALVDTSTHQLLHGITRPYSRPIQQLLLTACNHETMNLADFCKLDRQVGYEFSQAVSHLITQSQIDRSKIVAIGSHGQTIAHDGRCTMPYTMQVGCPHTIAEFTGYTVVADFRTRDMVVGGQGAPLAPLYHQALFAQYSDPLVVINIGGIANISYLNRGYSGIGYDIGPGNCLIDAWNKKYRQTDYDADGAWAATGVVLPSLLQRLLSDPYFTASKPKSIGKEYFSLAWLSPHLYSDYAPQDVQATLLELTVIAISEAVMQCPSLPQQAVICGGGVHNSELLKKLQQRLPLVSVASTQALGVNPDYLEAMMFAWLAAKALKQEPSDLTTITGAKTMAVLGAIYPAPQMSISHNKL